MRDVENRAGYAYVDVGVILEIFVLRWPKNLLPFFGKKLPKNTNKVFGQCNTLLSNLL